MSFLKSKRGDKNNALSTNVHGHSVSRKINLTSTMILIMAFSFVIAVFAIAHRKWNERLRQVKNVELGFIEPDKENLLPTATTKIDFKQWRIPDDHSYKRIVGTNNCVIGKRMSDLKIWNFDFGRFDHKFESPIDDGESDFAETKKEDSEDGALICGIGPDATYQGGSEAWSGFLYKSLTYPEQAIKDSIEGTVVVQFVIDRKGDVNDVQAVSGPDAGGLMEEAVRVIKKSGKWIPAVQKGRPVKSYKKQPIVFKLADQ